MRFWLIILGVLLLFIDFASYGFKYYVQDITLLGWIVYAVGALLLIAGLFMKGGKK